MGNAVPAVIFTTGTDEDDPECENFESNVDSLPEESGPHPAYIFLLDPAHTEWMDTLAEITGGQVFDATTDEGVREGMRKFVSKRTSTSHRKQTGTDADYSFFRSRQNLVGVVVAFLVIIVHIVVGLGVLWPLVAICGWGAGVMLTPKKQPPAIEKKAIPLQTGLKRTLTTTMRKLDKAEVPDRVMDTAKDLQRNTKYVLANWDDLEGQPEHQLTMNDVVNVYFPQVVGDYIDVPNKLHPDAVESVVKSIHSLDQAVERIRDGIIRHSLDTLSSNAKSLESKFASPTLTQQIESSSAAAGNDNNKVLKGADNEENPRAKRKLREYPAFED